MIVDYIDGYRDRFGVEPICAVLAEHGVPIAPSTFWARTAHLFTDAEWDDAHMANTVLDVWRANRSLYGADKLATAMRTAGHNVGGDQVARLMKILSIEGVRRDSHRSVTTRRDPAGVRHPDLVNRAWSTPTRPDVWWVADFAYVWTLAGSGETPSTVTPVGSVLVMASLATPGAPGFLALDPATGEERWRTEHRSGSAPTTSYSTSGYGPPVPVADGSRFASLITYGTTST